MLKALDQGIYKEVSCPCFGKQDVGISPGGAMDLFSMESGNTLLGNPSQALALELVFPPPFIVEEEGYIILTGAKFGQALIKRVGGEEPLPHGVVVKVAKGDILTLGFAEYGFRGYLCFKSKAASKGKKIEGRRRPSFASISSWRDPEGYIRVLRGPEFSYLVNPELFLKEGWTITPDLSDMGMRISCSGGELTMNMPGNMISEAVSDGTVQMTPKGPIILLKQRQTVGGYPRIFNVITADVDMLAQYGVGQILHFKEVSPDAARKAARLKNKEIKKLLV